MLFVDTSATDYMRIDRFKQWQPVSTVHGRLHTCHDSNSLQVPVANVPEQLLEQVELVGLEQADCCTDSSLEQDRTLRSNVVTLNLVGEDAHQDVLLFDGHATLSNYRLSHLIHHMRRSVASIFFRHVVTSPGSTFLHPLICQLSVLARNNVRQHTKLFDSSVVFRHRATHNAKSFKSFHERLAFRLEHAADSFEDHLRGARNLQRCSRHADSSASVPDSHRFRIVLDAVTDSGDCAAHQDRSAQHVEKRIRCIKPEHPGAQDHVSFLHTDLQQVPIAGSLSYIKQSLVSEVRAKTELLHLQISLFPGNLAFASCSTSLLDATIRASAESIYEFICLMQQREFTTLGDIERQSLVVSKGIVNVTTHPFVGSFELASLCSCIAFAQIIKLRELLPVLQADSITHNASFCALRILNVVFDDCLRSHVRDVITELAFAAKRAINCRFIHRTAEVVVAFSFEVVFALALVDHAQAASSISLDGSSF